MAKTGSDPLTISVCAVFLKARIKFLAGGADSPTVFYVVHGSIRICK